jgi:capsule biosynthesis phosphatase
MGKAMIHWVLSSIEVDDFEAILVPYHPDLVRYRFEDMLRKEYPKARFHFYPISSPTRGAVETVMTGLENVGPYPILCIDGDCFYTKTDIIKHWVRRNNKNCVFCFDDGNGPVKEGDKLIESAYSHLAISYVDIPVSPGVSPKKVTPKAKVTNFIEKVRVSPYACTGAYGFQNAHQLVEACKATKECYPANKRALYLSSAVLYLMEKEMTEVEPYIIPSSEWVCLGTPFQVRLFANALPSVGVENLSTGGSSSTLANKPLRLCFDFDNTLVTFPKIDGDYTSVEPIPHMIRLVKNLKRLGHTIIIYTARRMRTHKGNVGKIIADVGRIILDTLDNFEIPYDEINFGKPEANWYIDDLALSTFSDLNMELGFFDTNIDPRSFHSIESNSVKTMVKRGADLSGEIYYYLNIPAQVKDLFPFMFRHDAELYRFMELEYVPGVPATKLYISQTLTNSQIEMILNSLHRLHSTPTPQGNDGELSSKIYSNYATKIRTRMDKYYDVYNAVDPTGEIGQRLLEFLDDYEKARRGRLSVVHGDPVFTNIMFDHFGKIKLIDMRGKLGDQTTIFGDAMYDYAKVYQSILGYDEILECSAVEESYRFQILKLFENRFKELAGEDAFTDLKYICASLYYSLIPLHDVKNHFFFIEMAQKILNSFP